MNPKFYFIGGASRSGKSTLCRALSANECVSYFSLDFLHQGVERGLTQIAEAMLAQAGPAAAEKITHAIVPGLIDNVIYNDVSYILEGGWLQPDIAAQIKDRYRTKDIRICYVGYPGADPQAKVAEIRAYTGPNNYLSTKSDDEIRAHVKAQIRGSVWYKEEADKHGFIFCDTSQQFASSIEDAKKALLACP